MKGLGRTQKLIIVLLALDDRTVRRITTDGFGIAESTARQTLKSLGHRSIVDRRYSHGELVYYLTDTGWDVAHALEDEDSV